MSTSTQFDCITVVAQDLENYCRDVLIHDGVDSDVAVQVAQHLVEANVLGHDSHGVGMLAQYCSNLSRGLCRGKGSARIVHRSGPVLVMDAEKSFGQVALHNAIAEAAPIAQEYGVCLLTMRRVHHVGRLGAYAEHAAKLGLVSIFFGNINDHAPIVAPYGGSDARGSTNPISMGVPVGKPSVVLDFATSVWPLGKARVAFNRFLPLPAGVAIDPQGRPSTDPAVLFPGVGRGGAYTLGMKAKMGALTPFGQHKGAGLNIFCEFFGALAGGGTSAAGSPSNPAEGRQNGTVNNVFCVLINPSSLAADRWSDEMKAMIDWWVACPPAPGCEVLLPGDAEKRSKAVRLKDGVPLEPSTWDALMKLAGGAVTPPVFTRHTAPKKCFPSVDPSYLGFVLPVLVGSVIFAAGIAVGTSFSRRR